MPLAPDSPIWSRIGIGMSGQAGSPDAPERQTPPIPLRKVGDRLAGGFDKLGPADSAMASHANRHESEHSTELTRLAEISLA